MASISVGSTVRFWPEIEGVCGLDAWVMEPEDDGLDCFARWIGTLAGMLGEVVGIEEHGDSVYADVILQDGEELVSILSEHLEPVEGCGFW